MQHVLSIDVSAYYTSYTCHKPFCAQIVQLQHHYSPDMVKLYVKPSFNYQIDSFYNKQQQPGREKSDRGWGGISLTCLCKCTFPCPIVEQGLLLKPKLGL